MTGPTIHGDKPGHGQWNISSAAPTQEVELSQIETGPYSETPDTLSLAEGAPKGVPTSAHHPVLQAPSHAAESKTTEKPEEFVPSFNVSLYDEEFLEELAQHLEASTGLSPKQKQLARFSMFYPGKDVSKDPQVNKTIQEAVANAEKTAASTVGQKAGKNWKPPKPDPLILEMGYKGAVGVALENTGLPEDQRNKLELAHYHPELASSEVLEQYQKLGIADSVTALLAENNIAVPEDYKSSAFDKMVTDKYDSNYETLLQQQAGNLTEHQMDALRSAHYLQAPLEDESLAKIQTGLKLSAKSEVQKQFGVTETADFPPPNAAGYKLMMDANYRVSNEESVFKAVRELGADKGALLRTALVDPNAKGVSPEIHAKAAEITQQSHTKVSLKFSLPKTWQPEGAKLMTTPPQTRETQIKMLNYATDLHATAVKATQDLTDQQARITAMEFLKVTLAAIDKLRQEIAHQEAIQADSHKDIARAQNESVAFKIKMNREESDKVEEQNRDIAAKQKKLGPIQNAFKALGIGGPAIAIIMTVMSAGTLAGPALAFMAIMTALSALSLSANIAMAAGAEGHGLDVMSDVIGVGAQKLGDAIGGPGGKVIADIIMVVAMLGAARIGGGSYTSIAKEMLPQVAMLIANTNMMTDILVTSGLDRSKAAIAGAVLGGVLMAASAAGYAKLMKEGGMSNRGLLDIFRVVLTTSNVSASGLKFTASIYQKQIFDIQAEIARIQGEYSGKDARSQDIITQLKALLKQFEKTLEMLVGMYTDTTQLSGDIIKNAGDATRGLYQKGLQA